MEGGEAGAAAGSRLQVGVQPTELPHGEAPLRAPLRLQDPTVSRGTVSGGHHTDLSDPAHPGTPRHSYGVDQAASADVQPPAELAGAYPAYATYANRCCAPQDSARPTATVTHTQQQPWQQQTQQQLVDVNAGDGSFRGGRAAGALQSSAGPPAHLFAAGPCGFAPAAAVMAAAALSNQARRRHLVLRQEQQEQQQQVTAGQEVERRAKRARGLPTSQMPPQLPRAAELGGPCGGELVAHNVAAHSPLAFTPSYFSNPLVVQQLQAARARQQAAAAVAAGAAGGAAAGAQAAPPQRAQWPPDPRMLAPAEHASADTARQHSTRVCPQLQTHAHGLQAPRSPPRALEQSAAGAGADAGEDGTAGVSPGLGLPMAWQSGGPVVE